METKKVTIVLEVPVDTCVLFVQAVNVDGDEVENYTWETE